MKVKRKYIHPEIEILATEICVLQTVSFPQGTTEGNVDQEGGDEMGGGKHARSGDFFDDEEVDYYDDWL